jgi:type IV pilus assembly protein PilQ
MNKFLSRIIPVFIVFGIFAYNPVISTSVENPDQRKTADTKVGYLENVLFEKLPGKERIHLVVSEQPVITVSTQADGSLLVKLENMFAPDNLRGSLGEGALVNVVRVKPLQQLLDGKQFIYLTIDLKENVPYAIRQEEKNIFIDFNVSRLVEKKPVDSLVIKGKNKKAAVKKEIEEKQIEDIATVSDDVQENETKPLKKVTPKLNKHRLITLDFQDADIKTVLRLMAEYGNTSIISGDDVKGKVTLTIKNTPWDQALDSILDTQGLAKKQMGDVISVMTLERKKKDESDRVSAEADQRKAEDERKARETKILSEKGKLRQILIEAKIVEATNDFVRNIGITWGFGGSQSIGSYGSSLSGGTGTLQANPLQTNTWRQPYPSQVTSTDTLGNPLYMAAVNLPAVLASPTLGVIFGAGTAFLEAQLAALESDTTGRIISAPKVVTMDNVKAVMKQGDDVPYITQTVTSQGITTTVTFKEAVLKLEVKPRITDDGKISMEIKCGNDVPDYAMAAQLFGNPPIHKNEVESTVVIQDGDTVVIGGVLRDSDQRAVSGVPWIYKIPILGWLFKTESLNKSKRQLLVFITPKILKVNEVAGNSEKSLN